MPANQTPKSIVNGAIKRFESEVAQSEMASVSSSASPVAVPLRVSVHQRSTTIRPSVALMLQPSDTMLDVLRRALEFADTRKPSKTEIEELCAAAVR